MEHSPGTSAHASPHQPPTTLSEDMLLLDALLFKAKQPNHAAYPQTQDAIAAHNIRVCADALQRAVDGMGESVETANIDYVCDQLERVQESAGRAILAMVNARRDAIIDGYEDDDDDLPDTVTVEEPAIAQMPEKDGAA